MTEPPEQLDREPRDYCPRCQAAYEPLQEYCLECGERLPTNRGVVGYLAAEWQRRLAWYPGDWIWPVLLFLVLTIVATAAAVAAGSPRKNGNDTIAGTDTPVTVGPGAPQGTVSSTGVPRNTLPNAPTPTISTGTLPTPPGTPSTATSTTPAPAPDPNALVAWPAGKSGYTIVLESIPASSGRAAAVARARQAKQRGVKDVGVLVSSQYSSLHPGYFVVFSGIYASQAQASAALPAVHGRGYPDAYQTRVTR
jgi:hypothetical protein